MSIRGSVKIISSTLRTIRSPMRNADAKLGNGALATNTVEDRRVIIIPSVYPSPIVLMYDEKTRMYKVA
ncbi:hypothetical protein [Caldivirga maquilingensis]|uniref:Uncharacterized protein n=1 Tax=Caldivirga maquilingensis (strain ATCC 700844 / DSM 13496 / JCM 10307 / IC-167) TaxID=397948 RepID=A8MAS8_CALMQ|nr:hypothetical protein [Caldivirga maquilingensis]ABW01114.1 hypothetical protein Cmaq_0266 [Caldivirga maquilingensis IC-167]